MKLTATGHRMLLNAVVMDEELHAELQRDVTQVTTRLFVVRAPYVAWREGYRKLYDVAYGPRFGHKTNEKSKHNALKAITKELNYVDTHPALRKCGMFDIHHEIFPVWKVEPTELHPNHYSPYPQPGHQFVILVPTWRDHQLDEVKMTWWVERDSAEGRLCEEQLHLRLWREPTR